MFNLKLIIKLFVYIQIILLITIHKMDENMNDAIEQRIGKDVIERELRNLPAHIELFTNEQIEQLKQYLQIHDSYVNHFLHLLYDTYYFSQDFNTPRCDVLDDIYIKCYDIWRCKYFITIPLRKRLTIEQIDKLLLIPYIIGLSIYDVDDIDINIKFCRNIDVFNNIIRMREIGG